MSINESLRISDVLMFEAGEAVNYVRDAVTLLNGSAASAIGTVLGVQTVALSSTVAAGGGNTGTGGCVKDVTSPVLVNAIPGVYNVACIAAAAHLATFQVIDPKGLDLGTVTVAGALGTATFANRIKFAITQTATEFAVGDYFTVTVPAGSGKYSPLSLTAVDGTQNAAAVLLTPVPDALTADATVVAVPRGPVILKSSGLVWPAGATVGQIATGPAQLQALGMLTRIAYGV